MLKSHKHFAQATHETGMLRFSTHVGTASTSISAWLASASICLRAVSICSGSVLLIALLIMWSSSARRCSSLSVAGSPFHWKVWSLRSTNTATLLSNQFSHLTVTEI